MDLGIGRDTLTVSNGWPTRTPMHPPQLPACKEKELICISASSSGRRERRGTRVQVQIPTKIVLFWGEGGTHSKVNELEAKLQNRSGVIVALLDRRMHEVPCSCAPQHA
jgi:hypothetical protein